MVEIGFFLAALLAVFFTCKVNPFAGCLVWFLAMVIVALMVNGGWAVWVAILLVTILMLLIRYLLDKFFPLDENGEVIVKPKPCPVVLRRPAKFVLPNSDDEVETKADEGVDSDDEI